MKKIHIILLVLIAATIAVLISFLQNTSTYDTVDTAMANPGKFVHLMARVDKTQPVEYDPIKDPNYLSFTAVDTLGKSVKVVYNSPKPDNFDNSPRLVLQGKYLDGLFQCTIINTKCPSKYENDKIETEKKNATAETPVAEQSPAKS